MTLSSAATKTFPILHSFAFLKTWEIIDLPLIFKRGFPGSLVADIREGIIINVLLINFLYFMRLTDAKLLI